MKHYYRDIITRKEHYTRGKFRGWQRGGLLNAWYARFDTPRNVLLIPRYLLREDTRAQLPPPPVVQDEVAA